MNELLDWQLAARFLNSNFVSGLFGALTGAFAGAMAAQRIADRAKEREALRAEIRHTNAAITVAASICVGGLNLKDQVTRSVYDDYVKLKSDFEEHRRRVDQGEDLPVFELRADFRSFPMPLLPIDILRELVHEKISATGRPLALVAALAGSISSLSGMIGNRQHLIESFKQMSDEHRSVLPALYFGFPYGGGHVNEEFRDTTEGIHRMNDDVIFFSDLLCADLIKHGEGILQRYRKSAKLKQETINKVDFHDAQARGLMPDPENYSDWFSGFVASGKGDK